MERGQTVWAAFNKRTVVSLNSIQRKNSHWTRTADKKDAVLKIMEKKQQPLFRNIACFHLRNDSCHLTSQLVHITVILGANSKYKNETVLSKV